MDKPLRMRAALVAMILLTGCSSLLPSVRQRSESVWKSYDEAHTAFDRIQPGTTRLETLWELGFDPRKHPNIEVLNYLDIIRHFIPNDSIPMNSVDEEVRSCLQAKTDCHGYLVSAGFTYRKRLGNAFLDVFNFRRQTQTSGWKFQGLIVMNKDLVVYKLASGQPNILDFEDKKNPLGPLQDISVPAQVDLL